MKRFIAFNWLVIVFKICFFFIGYHGFNSINQTVLGIKFCEQTKWCIYGENCSFRTYVHKIFFFYFRCGKQAHEFWKHNFITLCIIIFWSYFDTFPPFSYNSNSKESVIKTIYKKLRFYRYFYKSITILIKCPLIKPDCTPFVIKYLLLSSRYESKTMRNEGIIIIIDRINFAQILVKCVD